ncbi:peptidoglycan-binding protein [Sinobaca sp. H24]|uniref:peptidoglycan-binding protein n=1 Tax=Sinobaca sp. H24 TaxID=2923376 RepID=UPI002079DC2C|nr:peptidoglycan-binding protein [Sinobaca sp. H24]
MKFQPSLKSWTKLGVPAVAAGFIFFAGPVNSEASELGDDLIVKGQESSQVESLQELLNDKGTLEKSAVSGTFGKDTKAAVTAYQEKHDLAVDGVAGPQTIGALEVLKHGSTGQPVESLQEDLSDLGLYNIEVDGIYGDKTEKAVTEFQSKSGISVDGLAGPETFGALHTVMTEAPSSNEAAPKASTDSKEKAPVEEKSSSEDTSSEDTSSEDTSSEDTSSEDTSSEDTSAQEAEEQAAAERQAALEEAEAQEAAEQEAAEREAAAEQAAEEAEAEEREEAAEQEAAEAEEAEEINAEQEAAAEAAAAEEAAEREAAAAEQAEQEAEEQEAEEAAQAEEEAAEQEAAEAEEAEEEASEEVVESSSSESSADSEASGDSFTAEATAYTAFCTGCSGTTATGVDLRANPNQNVIAVDPNVIPLGSTVEVEGMGTFTAADTGGAINGNRIDIFMADRSDAVSFGRQNLEVTVID